MSDPYEDMEQMGRELERRAERIRRLERVLQEVIAIADNEGVRFPAETVRLACAALEGK